MRYQSVRILVSFAFSSLIVGMLLAGCGPAERPAAAHPPSGAPAPAGSETAPAQAGGPQASAPPPPETRALTRADLTEAEIEFGRAPQPHPSITYQPDVVVVGGGPASIRSAGPDGFSWVLDANAPQVDRLAPGRIAFVTGRCVGRVLHMERAGNDLRVILGPVELTEIYETLEYAFSGKVDLAEALAYAAPAFANVSYPLGGEDVETPEWAVEMPSIAPAAWHDVPSPLLFRRASFGRQQDGPVAPGIPQRIDMGFRTFPLSNADGIGVELHHEAGGVAAKAQMQIRVATPDVDVRLSIVKGRVNGRAVLKNAAGLRMAFDAAVSQAFSGNVNWAVPGPSLSIPLPGAAPIALDIRQTLWVKTAFSAKQASFSAGGNYDLNADIGLIVNNGTLQAIGPKGLTVRQSLMQNMGGVSLGPTGMLISHEMVLTSGLGAVGFTAGPRVHLGTSIGVAQGPTIGIVRCKVAALSMRVKGGFGWTIPRVVAKFVNFFLRLVRVREIPEYGGVTTNWVPLIRQQALTDSPICGSTGS